MSEVGGGRRSKQPYSSGWDRTSIVEITAPAYYLLQCCSLAFAIVDYDVTSFGLNKFSVISLRIIKVKFVKRFVQMAQYPRLET